MVHLEDLSSITRLQPYAGLVIDPQTWATAHDYHRRHHQLHLRALHGSGIVVGLSVRATDPPSDTVLVERGMAIDDLGNVILVGQSQRLAVPAQPGTVYLAVEYVETLAPSAVPGSGEPGETRGRVIEDFRLRVLESPPVAPLLELGRVSVEPRTPLVVNDATDAWDPGTNEIDLRFRNESAPGAPQHLALELLLTDDGQGVAPHHRQGFRHVASALGHAGFRVRVIEGAGPQDAAGAANRLLYVTGSAQVGPSKEALSRVAAHRERGGWVFIDPCGPGDAVLTAFAGLADDPDAAARSSEQVITAYHVFGTAPQGAAEGGDVAWGDRTILSSRDFGCAWGGQQGGQAVPREQIRSAIEFAVNVAACAVERPPLPSRVRS